MSSSRSDAPDSQSRVTGGAPSPERVSEAPFRLLVESVVDYAIFILDLEGRVATWNAGAERIKGYSSGEIIGKHFSTFYPSDVAASGKCDQELEIVRREGRFEEEGWRLRKDGTRLWANVTITALRNAEGALVGYAKVTQDLTERKVAEEEARRFRLLVESVKDYAIFILDPTGHVLTWNAGAERIKGYTEREIVGKHFSTFYPPEAVAAGQCELELDVARREGRFEEEGIRVRKDGSLFWANVTITVLRDANGAVVGFAKVTRDLTERKAAEESLRELAVERAALAEKARIQEFQERFLAILGHDLRNPLAAIDMGAGLIRQRATDPTTLRVLERMTSSSRRMTRMIAQILDLTRSRLAGGLEIVIVPMDLREPLAAIVDELHAAHPSRVIDLQCSPIPGKGDRDRLEQVFSNLIGNAVAYGDPSMPVRVVAVVDGDRAKISVHNHGEAIPEDVVSTLFNPFRRGERESRTAKTTGLGLGLYISYELIRAHRGTIEARSDAGGTTFTVTLPLDGEPVAQHPPLGRK
jgi:PAS domain S-box-containing protein